MSGFGPTGMGTRAGPGFPHQVPQPGAGAGGGMRMPPQGMKPSTPPPVMTPPQQQRPDYLKDALNGVNTFGEQLKGAHRQRLNNVVTNLSNSGRGMSLTAEGQPQSVKRMNPDQLREYHDNIFEHQNQINGYVKEIGYLNTANQVRTGQEEAAYKQVQESFKRYIDSLDAEDMTLGRNKSVSDRLNQAGFDLQTAFRGEAIVGGTAEGRAGARAEGNLANLAGAFDRIEREGREQGLSPVEIHRRKMDFAKDRATGVNPTSPGFFETAMEDLDEAFGGVGEGAVLGAGAAVLSFIPGVNIGFWGLMGLGALVGIGADLLYEGEEGEFGEKRDRFSGNEIFSPEYQKRMQLHAEDMLLAQTAIAMRDLGRTDADNKTGLDEDAYNAMKAVMSLNGQNNEDVLNQLNAIYDKSGFDLNEIHASMSSMQDYLLGQDRALAEGIDQLRVMPGSAREQAQMKEQIRILQMQQENLQMTIQRNKSGLAALESLGYENAANPANRLVTYKQQREAAEELFKGQLAGLATGKAPDQDVIANLLRDLPPDMAEQFTEYMTGRQTRETEGREVLERLEEVQDLMSEEEVMMRETMADDMARFTRDNVADLNEQREIESLLREIETYGPGTSNDPSPARNPFTDVLPLLTPRAPDPMDPRRIMS